MLTAMLRGRRACGRWRPATSAPRCSRPSWTPHPLRRPRRRAVELPAALVALRRARAPRACLNLAPDHVDWHGSLTPTPGDKARVYERDRRWRASTTSRTPRRSGWCARRRAGRLPGRRLHARGARVPASSGVVEDVLVDRAFVPDRGTSAAELATLDDLRAGVDAPRRPAPRRQRAGRRGAGAGARRAPGRGRGRGCAASRPDAAPRSRASPRCAGRALGRRLQGHQPARRRRVAWRAYDASSGSPAGCPRAPTSTTSSRRRRRLRAAVLIGRDRAPIAAGAGADTRRMSRSSRWASTDTERDGRRSWRHAARPRPARATSCCSRPPAPPWTCSPTTARAATPSPTRCGASPPRGSRGERPPHRPAARPGRARSRLRALGAALRLPGHHVLPAARPSPSRSSSSASSWSCRLSAIVSLDSTSSAYTVFTDAGRLRGASGLPPCVVASRMPVRAGSGLAVPVLSLGVGAPDARLHAARRRRFQRQPQLDLPRGPVSVQPSEAIKVGAGPLGGAVLARKRPPCAPHPRPGPVLVPLVGLAVGAVRPRPRPRHRCDPRSPSSPACSSPPGPDAVFAIAGVPFVAVASLVLVVTSSNRLSRFDVWLGRDTDMYGAARQPIHGRYALADGGWWGSGWARAGRSGPAAGGAQRLHLRDHRRGARAARAPSSCWLSSRRSAVGLLRVVAPLATTSSSRSPPPAVMAWIARPGAVNIGAVIGMLPVIGVPLPLVSSGGSALITDDGRARHGAGLRPPRAGCRARRWPRAAAGVLRRSLAVAPSSVRSRRGPS